MSAIWPTGVAGDGDLFVAKNNLSTTLNGAVDAVTTTIVLASAAAFPASGYATIGTEAIKYTGISVNTLTGVTRGADGTTAASHLNGTAVNHYAVAAHHNNLKDEIVAVETSLNLTASKAVVTNASGRVAASVVTDTELGYVAGLTSSAQTQLNTIKAIHTDTHEPTGFPDASTTTISVVDGTRTFTIAPTGASFEVYVAGTKFTKTSESVTFTDTEGVWYFYYNSAGTLTASQTAWDLALAAPVALLYWNATDNVSLDLADERHGSAMDWATHKYLHTTVGTRFVDGLAASGYVLNSAVNADVRFAFSSGAISDEDLLISIAAQTEPAQIPVFYRAGASGPWKRAAATDYPYLTTGTGRIAYNLDTAGTWSQAEVSNGDFSAYWIFATNGKSYPIISIQGQRLDTSLANAQNNNLYESLSFGTLPYAEMKLLFRVIVQTSNAYGSTMKVRVADVQDLRSVSNLPSGSYVASAHGSLTGRSDAGSHPATAISNTPAGSISATDVQSALNELDTEKQAALGYTPVNRAGDTMTGVLQMSDVNKVAFFTGDYFVRASTGLEIQSADIIRFLGAGAAEFARFDSTGKLGIGVTPNATLHVDSPSGGIIRATRLGTGSNAVEMESDGTDGVLRSDGALILSSGGANPRITIDSSGNVGVGAAPSAKLHVTSAINNGIKVTDGTVTGIAYSSGTLTNSFAIGTTSNHPLILGTNNTFPQITLATTGYLTVPGVYANTDASAANVYVDSSGNLKRSTVSLALSGAITTSGLTQATGKLLGRSTASTGAVEEITVGSGLTLSGGSLSASGGAGSGTVNSGASSRLAYYPGTGTTVDDASGNGSLSYSDSASSTAMLVAADTDKSAVIELQSARSAGGGKQYIQFNSNTDRVWSMGLDAVSSSDNNFKIGYNTFQAPPSNGTVLTIKTDGKVGIGVSPSYSLDIKQSLSGNDVDFNLENTNASANGVYMFMGSAAGYCKKQMKTTGTGDVHINFVSANSTTKQFTMGIDYSDTKAFVISRSGTLGTSNVLKFVESNGYVAMQGAYDQTTASAANMFVDSSGNIMRSTSSLRYKTAIAEVAQEEAAKLLDLTPVTYASTCERDDKEERHYGFIAEELDLLDPVLVNYKTLEDGSKVPDGVQYERVVVGLLKLVQDLTKRVADLEAKQA